jgi:hypothetical protein
MANGSTRPWNEAADAQLTQLWSQGYSTADIGARMGGRTKNAIVGRSHRLGLAARPSAIKRPDGYQPKPRPPSKPRVTLPAMAPAAVAEPKPVAPPKVAAYRPPVVSASARCQFPLWGFRERPTHRYCDAPAVVGTSWCAACHEIVYTGRIASQTAAVQSAAA